MHSRDPGKSDEEFQREFERILKDAGTEVADFSGFVFLRANYFGRVFSSRCIFAGATFTQEADFMARFKQGADFSEATFTLGANFFMATFDLEADFVMATFTQKANFGSATFYKQADFRCTKFLGPVDFRRTDFRPYPEAENDQPSPLFSDAEFFQPESVRFYKTYLGQALFHNCDVSKVVFSSVEWRVRKGSGKRMVFEEEIRTDYGDPAFRYFGPELALVPQWGDPNERNYGLIAELYQQLKKNYDDRKDHWTAGDFHYGEMEMKRLSSRRKNRIARWLHRHLGLVALYKCFSQYGESYLRPGFSLVLFLLAFAAAYPLVGLRYDARRETAPASSATSVVVLTYWQPFRPSAASPTGKWSAWVWWVCGRTPRLCLFGHSLMSTLQIATLQKELVYEPVYPCGRFVPWCKLC